MPYPKTRKELFSHVARRLEANTAIVERTGKPSRKQLKVFWLEVNPKYSPLPSAGSGWEETERRFYVLQDRDEAKRLWLEASDERIWRIYTFGPRDEVEQIIKRKLLSRRGLDRVWLAEPFMEKLRKEHGYQDRGFRLYFHDTLSSAKNPSERPKFSAKFWLGEEVPSQQKRFLDSARQTFSRSSLRLGRESRNPVSRISGLLVEIYSEGCMTITTSEEPEEVLGLANEVGQRYREQLGELEGRRLQSPRPVELNFGMPVNLERFQSLVESGQGQAGLWMQRYAVDGEMHRYTGTDLHTSELINLDVGQDYAYLVTQKGGCMNAAPRLMTISAQRLSGKTGLFYEGVPLFA